MDNKCRQLVGKYIDDDEKIKTIRVYHCAIMLPRRQWTEIYDKFFNARCSEDQKASVVSKRLKLFKPIAEENGIPYLDALRLRDMTEETRSEIIEKMIAQLRPEGVEEADSNFACHTDK